jgi:hypothetical protein
MMIEGSGSGRPKNMWIRWIRIRWIRIRIWIRNTVLPNPNPYPFQPNVKLNYTFSQNISIYLQKIELWHSSSYDAGEKDETV